MSSNNNASVWVVPVLSILIWLGIILLLYIYVGRPIKEEQEKKAHEEALAAKEAEADSHYREGLYAGFMQDIKAAHPDIDIEWQNKYMGQTFTFSSLRRNPPTSLDIENVMVSKDLALITTVSDIYDTVGFYEPMPGYRGFKVIIVTGRLKYELFADYEMVEKAYQLELDKGFAINPRVNKRLFIINPSHVIGEVTREASFPEFTVKGSLTAIYELPEKCERGESFCDFKG